VVQRDALAKVDGALVKRLPVEVQLEVVRQVHANVGARRHAPEGGAQLAVVHPDLDVLAVEELVQPAGMVEVQMTNDDLLDVFELVARRFDGRFQLVLRFVAYAREDVGNLGAPDGGVVLCGEEKVVFCVSLGAEREMGSYVEESLTAAALKKCAGVSLFLSLVRQE